MRKIADEVGALLLFDAAHLCGMIAGRSWPNPLDEGAHLMTMSTYKSLGGPASGLIVTSDPAVAEKLDAIAFPGMTANFDAAKSASLAITLLDWKDHGQAYAAAMVATARALANNLVERGIPVYSTGKGITTSHQFAVTAASFGGGQAAAKKLRVANILTCGIGLPIAGVDGDMNGLRFGTPEIVRWGMTEEDMPALAALIVRGLRGNESSEQIAADVTAFRRQFRTLHFIN
jgi:glycine hydroxymethyltransferase